MPSGLNIFVLLGQSNMLGKGLLADLPAGHPAFASHIWNYKLDGTWQNPPVEPIHDRAGAVYAVLTNGDPFVGPGLFFADHFYRYRSDGPDIGLVPCAVGASSIADWARPPGGTDTGTMYGASRARWQAAAESGSIAGVILYQGEADTDSTASANAWAAAFTQLVSDLRSDIGDANLPIVAVQIGPCSAAHLLARPDWPLLQANQAKIVKLPRVAIVQIVDAPLLDGDAQHISTAGQRMCGERIANAMRVLGAGL
jgi:hypothetical protein